MIGPSTESALPVTGRRRVIVCAGTGCVANGAYPVFQAFTDQIKAAGIPATTEFKAEENDQPDAPLRLNQSGCQGFCQMGPLVTILPEGILYTKVRLADVPEIVASTLVGHELVTPAPKSPARASPRFRSISASSVSSSGNAAPSIPPASRNTSRTAATPPPARPSPP